MMSPKTMNPAMIFSRISTTLPKTGYDFGDDRFGLGVGFGAGRGGGRGDLADGLCGDLLAVHFEFLPRRTAAGTANHMMK